MTKVPVEGWDSLPLSALAMAILFGTATLLYVMFEISQFLQKRLESEARYAPVALDSVEQQSEAEQPAPVAETPKATGRFEEFRVTNSSIRSLLLMLTQLGAIMLYSWVCENKPFFEHGSKHPDADQFWFLALLFFAVCFMKVEKTGSTDILNRDQTEEWKGWMQYIFLAYHYFHFGAVYNSVRVFISCYVWMTGFGNFSFFYIKQDFSWIRWWNMMWRLNFLVFLLCMVHNNTYILYYICPLHTFYFLMVYVTMRIGSSVNHSKYKVRAKIMVLAVVIFVVWEIPGVFEKVFFFLPHTPTVGAPHGSNREFHFRTSLDHWSSFFGMIFALNFPMYTAWLKKVETLSTLHQTVIKGSIAALLIGGAAFYFAEVYPKPKLAYNEDHPYVFLLPMLAYIFIRNISVGARSWHLHHLAEMGKMTLETYLMQHHIWLTSNAKTLLVLVPGYPQVNMFVTTLIYLVLSRRLYRLTLNLRAMLIPKGFVDSFKYLAWMVSAILVACLLALTLQATRTVNVGTLLFTSLIGSAAVLGVFRLHAKNQRHAEVIALCLAVVSIVALIIHAVVQPDPPFVALAPTAAPAPTPPPSPVDPSAPDGIAQSAMLGLVMVLAGSAMLFFFDNFYGLSWVAVKFAAVLGFKDISVTFEEAYDKLNRSILGLPTRAPRDDAPPATQ